MNQALSSSEVPLDLVKPMIRTSNVEIVFIYAAELHCATSKVMLHARHQVNIETIVVKNFSNNSNLFINVATITRKAEVKACHTCKGAEACKPEKLTNSEIRTSGAFGGKNLYCYTVC